MSKDKEIIAEITNIVVLLFQYFSFVALQLPHSVGDTIRLCKNCEIAFFLSSQRLEIFLYSLCLIILFDPILFYLMQ